MNASQKDLARMLNCWPDPASIYLAFADRPWRLGPPLSVEICRNLNRDDVNKIIAKLKGKGWDAGKIAKHVGASADDLRKKFSPRGRGDDLYFISARSLGMIKIGRALEPRGRLSDLRVASPVELQLESVALGRGDQEKWMHGLFEKDYQRGEWFKFTRTIHDLAQRLNDTELDKDDFRELVERVISGKTEGFGSSHASGGREAPWAAWFPCLEAAVSVPACAGKGLWKAHLD